MILRLRQVLKESSVLQEIENWLKEKHNIRFICQQVNKKELHCRNGIKYLIRYCFESKAEELLQAGEKYFKHLTDHLKKSSQCALDIDLLEEGGNNKNTNFETLVSQ